MRNKRMLCVLMAMILVLPSFLVRATVYEHAAAEATSQNFGEYSFKDEVVYATLSASGEKQKVYVVNIFDVVKEGNIVDYGTYADLKNLTDLSEIEQKETTVKFTAPEGKFYYQGNMNDAELPWDITISYLLDGNQIDPMELAGKDGDVEIKIQSSANESVERVFFENYLLQISLSLDPEIFENIETTGGMIANAGKNKQVTFTVMPQEEAELTIKAAAVDFELQGIEIAAIPQSISIDVPNIEDMTAEMKTLTDAIRKISNGVGELNNGVSELNNGVVSLRNGSKQYQKGISDINESSIGLLDASLSIDEGLSTMSKSISGDLGGVDVSDLNELPNGLLQIADGLRQTEAGLSKLKKNYAVAYISLNDAMTAIPNHELTEAEIQDLYISGASSEVIDKLVETYTAARTAKGTYSAVKEVFVAVAPTLNEVSGSLTEMANTLEAMAIELSNSLEGMNAADSIGELQEGLASVSSNYKEFHAGLVSYTDGVGQLSNSYNDVHTGIVDLSNGTVELKAGVEELDEGTDKLYQSTKDMPEQMQEEVDQMIADYDKTDFNPISFVSSENEKINSVQFVMKTESIEKPEPEFNEEQEQEEQEGFWERLIALFKGIWG